MSTTAPQAKVLSKDDVQLDDSSSSSSDDDDEIDQRRADFGRVDSIPKAATVIAASTKAVDSDSESGSDEGSDSDEDHVMLKPVFVPKSHRATIREQEERLRKEEELEELKLKQQEERKIETKQLVKEAIQREKEDASKKDEGELDDLPDDNDDVNQKEERELWKEREFARLRRDKEERLREERDLAERERRRNMTDEELLQLQQQDQKKDERGKLNFLQKSYHKGAFFMETDDSGKLKEELYARDYSAPTLEDRVDRSTLPKVLQVKNFGKAGRTKYTHLKDQDTTDYEAGWNARETAKKEQERIEKKNKIAERPVKKKKFA